MEIEIVTTKKRLTKSIISQMPQAGRHDMRTGNVLGYITKARKDSYYSGLIERNGEYYWLALNWSKGETAVYRKTNNKWSTNKQFESSFDCNEWWKEYEQAREKCLEIHIYI